MRVHLHILRRVLKRLARPDRPHLRHDIERKIHGATRVVRRAGHVEVPGLRFDCQPVERCMGICEGLLHLILCLLQLNWHGDRVRDCGKVVAQREVLSWSTMP